jgi:hypothetical protein
MISAIEAVKLTVLSAVNLDRYLDVVDYEITRIATEGGRKYVCYIDGLWNTVVAGSRTQAKYDYSAQQRALAGKLRESGYSVGLGEDSVHYVPRGLQEDDDGSGTEYVNMCLQITW